MKKVVPKIIALTVYKTKDNTWRGFCVPYDVACEDKNKLDAMRKLERLVKLYEEGLKRYGYPKHLSIRKLSEKEDAIVFNKIMKKIASDVEDRLNKDFIKFESEQEKEKFSIKSPSIISYYYHPEPCFA